DSPSRLTRTSIEKGESIIGYMGKRYAANYKSVTGKVKDEAGLKQCFFELHQLLGGLAFAASHNIGHRDIKNDNYLVKEIADHPGFLLVHLADWSKAYSLEDALNLEPAFRAHATREDFQKAQELLKAGDKAAFLEHEKRREAFAMGCLIYYRL